jgi:integrase
MRSGEITGLTSGQVDMATRVLTVGRAKTASGTGCQIPVNYDLFQVCNSAARARSHTSSRLASHNQLTRPTTSMKTVSGSIRDAAQVECRLHDLRHTALTQMAEAGVPESTMLVLAGHLSQAMLERYSHIRMTANEALRR